MKISLELKCGITCLYAMCFCAGGGLYNLFSDEHLLGAILICAAALWAQCAISMVRLTSDRII